MKISDKNIYLYNKIFYKLDEKSYRDNLYHFFHPERGFYNSVSILLDFAKIYKRIEHNSKYLEKIDDDVFPIRENVEHFRYYCLEDLFDANIVYQKYNLAKISRLYKYYLNEIKDYLDFCERMVKVKNPDFKTKIYNPEINKLNIITKEAFFSILENQIEELNNIDIFNSTNEIKMNEYDKIAEITYNQCAKIESQGKNNIVLHFRFKKSYIPKIWLNPMKKHLFDELNEFIKSPIDVFNLVFLVYDESRYIWLKTLKNNIKNDNYKKSINFYDIKENGMLFRFH